VTARGMTTSATSYDGGVVVIRFDFVAQTKEIETCHGEARVLALEPQSVAECYQQFLAALAALDVRVTASTMPVELPDPVPFDRDPLHGSYDAEAAHRSGRSWPGSMRCSPNFRGRFLGKVSPVPFWWGKL
jgi:hypothetical protein